MKQLHTGNGYSMVATRTNLNLADAPYKNKDRLVLFVNAEDFRNALGKTKDVWATIYPNPHGAGADIVLSTDNRRSGNESAVTFKTVVRHLRRNPSAVSLQFSSTNIFGRLGISRSVLKNDFQTDPIELVGRADLVSKELLIRVTGPDVIGTAIVNAPKHPVLRHNRTSITPRVRKAARKRVSERQQELSLNSPLAHGAERDYDIPVQHESLLDLANTLLDAATQAGRDCQIILSNSGQLANRK